MDSTLTRRQEYEKSEVGKEVQARYKAKYREDRREELRLDSKARYEANREQKKVEKQWYYEAHREEHRANAKRWEEENRDRMRLITRKNTANRRARLRDQFVEDVDPQVVYEMHGGMCGICEEFIVGDFHVDHVIPLSRGGLHGYVNVQPSHPFCNLSKGNREQVMTYRPNA